MGCEMRGLPAMDFAHLCAGLPKTHPHSRKSCFEAASKAGGRLNLELKKETKKVCATVWRKLINSFCF